MCLLYAVWISVANAMLLSHETSDLSKAEMQNLTFIHDPEMRKVVRTHLRACGDTFVCNLALQSNGTQYSPIYTCGPCDCDESCAAYGTCCPDLYDKLEPPSAANKDTEMHKCVFVTVPFQNFSSLQSVAPKKLISSCPKHIPVTSILVERCHQDYHELWSADLQEDAIPVTERLNTRNNFKNMYCAMCHGLQKSDVTFWPISIVSSSFSHTPNPEHSFDDRLSFLHELKNFLFTNINIIFLMFNPPSNVPTSAVECRIQTCNVSGLWQQYDNFTERACRLYNHGILNNAFANIFCALCNELETFKTNLLHWDFPASYLALVDINDLDPKGAVLRSDPANQQSCVQGYIFDPVYEICRKLFCSILFYLHDNTCRLAYKSLQDFQYIIVHQYRLLKPQPLTKGSYHRMNNSILEEITDYLQSINDTRGYDLTLRQINFDHLVKIRYNLKDKTKPVILDVTLIYVEVTIVVELNEILSSPQTLEEMIQIIEELWNCNFYSSHFVKGEYPEFPNNFNDVTVNFRILNNQVNEYLRKTNDDDKDSNLDFPTTAATRPQPEEFLMIENPFIDQYPISESAIFIQPNHSCVKVLFTNDEYRQTTNGIFLPALNLYIPIQLSLSLWAPAAGVCLQSYLNILKQHLPNKMDYVYSTQTIVSLACSSISALSLLITMAIYATIKDLQTLPGLMITRLCLNLLLCQIVYVLTNSIHITVAWLCSCLGLLLHFFTLSYLFWMNISTLHMLKAFTSTTLVSNRNRLPWKYGLLVHGMAAVFILINITVRMVATETADFGYGGDICYINNSFMIGVTFVLPLGFVVVSNTVMFILAIRSVVTADKITAISHRKYILIFMKLSTLTGITWVFGLLHQWFPLDILAYMFIILNTSQGLFVMVAFVFNQRTYKIMKKMTSSTNITQ